MTNQAAVCKYFESKDHLVSIEMRLKPWGYTISRPKRCPEWWMTKEVGVAMWYCRGWTYAGIGRAYEVHWETARRWVKSGIKIIEKEIGDNNNVTLAPFVRDE